MEINFPNKGFPRKGQILPAPGGNLSKGKPLAKLETWPYCQSLSLWERWHCVSNDGEGEDAEKRSFFLISLLKNTGPDSP